MFLKTYQRIKKCFLREGMKKDIQKFARMPRVPNK
jgi:hypothetical protein